QHAERLPQLAVEACLADLVLEDVVGLAQHVEALARGFAADDADREPGAGERLAPHQALGQAQLGPDGAHLVLEQRAQRLDELEAESVTFRVSRKSVTTCSPASLRMRPWSTNTHVSWSPTARCTSSAATEESTPPESPQMTLPSPTWARMRLTCSSTIEAADQERSQRHTSLRKRVRICWP